MSVNHTKLREIFSKYWESKDHKEVPPIPLVPKDDPTTLFTGSGMQQLIPYLLGEPHPLGEKLYNIQPCFRSQDIEEVGDNRHTTFFEMMGNWSLGTYFKQEQLEWCWNFFTKELFLPEEKLYVSVFAGTKNLPKDSESASVWKKLGVPENRIFYYGPEKNWWSRAGVPENMPEGEPGGPDSEVFYEFNQIKHNPKFGNRCHPNCDCGRFLEIGNSVFMQYKKGSDGTFQELPKKNVDFGGGLERILAAINNDPDNFKIDVIWPIIKEFEGLTKIKYDQRKRIFRIIVDHVRAAVQILAAGVTPSNIQQGYLLRRLIRRAVDQTGGLNFSQSLAPLLISVINIYSKVYTDLATYQKNIIKLFSEEENKYKKTIQSAIKTISDKAKIIKKISGNEAFKLHTTYGLSPVQIKEQGYDFNEKDYQQAFEKHRQLSRSSSAGMFKGGLADHGEQVLKYHTATHLIHQALFDVLGKDVKQEGSNITAERLRFDFFALTKPSEEEILKIAGIVNEKIKEKLPVSFKILPKEEALKIGAKSFFKEKYPEKVKVYFIGNYSKEFCGGPHVKNTSEINHISIYKLEKTGSNVYRIYAK